MELTLPGTTALVGAVVLVGCLGSAPHEGANGARNGPEPDRTPGATVVSGSRLLSGLGLLDALVGRVSAMRVQGSGACPRITLRGQKTMVGNSEPTVYIDGTRAVDTCILNMLRADEVERIEVYPMGVAHRPGYRSDPYGLILVFMRRAES